MESKIILIHGSHHASWCWENFNNEFKKYYKKENIICFELLGHGKKNINNKTYTLDDYSNDLNVFLNRFLDEKIIIIAHSLGCLVTYNYLINSDNNNIVNIFFLAPAIGITFLDMSFKISYNLLFNGVFSTNKEDIRTLFFTEFTNDSIIENCYNNLETKNSTNMISLLLSVFRYRVIKNKIHIISAECDNVTTPEFIRKSRYLYNNNIYKCFEKIGHDMMLDNGWEKVFLYIFNEIKDIKLIN